MGCFTSVTYPITVAAIGEVDDQFKAMAFHPALNIFPFQQAFAYVMHGC